MAKEINTKILGGWLILVQAYILFNAIVWLKNLQLFYGLVSEKSKLIEALGNNPNIGMYTAFIYYELIASIIFTLFMFVLFFIFFKKWKQFPRLMTIVLIGQLVSEIFTYFFFGPISGYGTELLQKLIFSCVIAIVLIVYLRVSKRVQLTFLY